MKIPKWEKIAIAFTGVLITVVAAVRAAYEAAKEIIFDLVPAGGG